MDNPSIAKDILFKKGVSVFVDNEQILKPTDDSNSTIEYKPRLIAGTELLDETEKIKKIYDYDILRANGLMIKSRPATENEKTSTYMRVKYYLAKYVPKDPDEYGYMPVLPHSYKGKTKEFRYYVEYDVVENKARLCGPNTSVLGKDIEWFYLEGGHKKKNKQFTTESLIDDPLAYFRESTKELHTRLDQQYFNIIDTPFMITEQGELLAIPNDMGDVGHKLICGATGCMPKGTLIRTPYGLVPIENADIVWSYDFDNTRIEKKKAIVYNSGKKKIVKIYTKKGIVTCSREHKWFVVRDYEIIVVKTKELLKTDKLIHINMRLNGLKYIVIEKIDFTDDEVEMFDLSVENNHNFILKNGIITHNSGKTTLLHLLLEGDYFLTNSNLYYMNDSVRQTETWCKENNATRDKFKLALFNILPNSLPVVYLFPKLSEDTILIMPNEEISHEFSLSFDDLMSDFDMYMEGLKNNEFGASGGYLDEHMDRLKNANNLAEINKILEELLSKEIIGKGSYGKLRKIFKVLDKFNIIDKFNNVSSKWTFIKDKKKITTYPMIGLAENGVIPIIVTDMLKSKNFYPQEMGVLLKEIADNQKHNKTRRSKIYYDELSDAFMKGNEKTILSKTIREITLKGRNTDIELIATMQDFSKVDDAIRNQLTYVFSFVHNDEDEITAIAKHIGLDKSQKETIRDLDKLQCFAWCRGDVPFVVYSPNKGRKVVYGKERSLYRGRLLPTFSLHKIPNKRSNND